MGGGSDGKGSRVVLPCLACRFPTNNFSKVVPTHNEARFRASLAMARQRLSIGPEVEFGTLSSEGRWREWRRGDRKEGGVEEAFGERGNRGGKSRAVETLLMAKNALEVEVSYRWRGTRREGGIDAKVSLSRFFYICGSAWTIFNNYIETCWLTCMRVL